MTGGMMLGPYETLSLLGQGGMGEVWKAHDSRLRRTVAIKLLHAEFSAQIEQEARAIAALSNPHICTLHDIRVENGTRFLVMEYLEGKPFRGPMPVEPAIRHAIEVLDGLHSAHSIGVIHLDLKPANILITRTGAKLLDFGLARRKSHISRASDGSQTITMPQVHAVAGTPAYMAPEQLEGRDVDARADIFAFGCVLYEVLTGKTAFAGNSVASTISAVLSTEPRPIGEVQPGVPLDLEWIIRRCLAKDRSARWQSTLDLKAVLERFLETSGREQVVRRRRMPWWAWASFTILFAAGASAGGWWLAGKGEPPTGGSAAESAFEIAGGEASSLSPSWSPDGKWLVYSSFRNGNYDLWKRPLAGGSEVMVTSTNANETAPAWSPKGNVIAFSSSQDGGGIYLVHPDGGAPTRLAPFGANPSWSPDADELVFDWQGAVYTVNAGAGEPKQILPCTSGRTYAIFAASRHEILLWHRARSDIFRMSLQGDLTPMHLVPPGEEVNGLSASADGRWLYFSRGAFGGAKDLWRVRLSPRSGLPIGEPARITLPLSDHQEVRVSPDGTRIAFSMHRTKRHLWIFKLDPSTGIVTGQPRQFTSHGHRNYYPALSPDGRTVVYTSQDSDMGLLYHQALEGGSMRKLTQEWGRDNREVLAAFAPNGEIVFASTLLKAFELYRMPSLGGVALRITSNPQEHRDTWPEFSPDGRNIVFQSNREGNEDLWIVSSDGSSRRPLTTSRSNEAFPMISPDGSQLAYVTDLPGNPDIWVRNIDGSSDRPLVQHPATDGPGDWSPDGSRFYFLSDRGGSISVWVMPSSGGDCRRAFTLPAEFSLPEVQSYGRFAVGAHELIVPLEIRDTSIFVLNGVSHPARP